MRIKQLISIGLVIMTSSSLVIGFSSGPPDGVTGGPGEGVCTDCHFTNPLNMAGGTIALTTSVATYDLGDTIAVEIDLSRTGQERWGFEITALSSSNVRIGKILDTSVFTQLTTSISGRQYLKHVTAGTFEGTLNESPGWGFRWVAPVTDSGPVTFYVAGNAADGNLFNTGDFIYTTNKTIPPTPPGPCCVGIVGNVDCDAGEGVDIGDLTVLVDHLFISFTPLCCEAEGNVDLVGGVDIGDLTKLVDHLFISFAPLDACI